MKTKTHPPSLHPTHRHTQLQASMASPVIRWLALLALCSAYIQGGLVKAFDFSGAMNEMRHFGLEPAWAMAVATIALELVASAMVLSGRLRWLGALALAVFTLAATFIANRFWDMPPANRFMAENAFFEHIGLTGGFCLVAWLDLQDSTGQKAPERLHS